MKTPIEMRVLTLFTEGVEAYSISEIARATKAAYPHAHASVTEMITEGLLNKRIIGRSVYVWPNLANPTTRNILGRAYINQRARQLTIPNELNLQKEIELLFEENVGILSVIHKEGKLYFIIADQKTKVAILKNTSLINISFLTSEELKEDLLNSPALLRNSQVLTGEERLLLIIHSIHKELLLKHTRLFCGEAEE